ncbi:MAG TPA: efflux RND transporter periplasmic adaptor subunit [Burkholderiales bacterium]|nr:efflux RND transporter periplasmic adaptor subunit [Burkholderiales bacterium]
MKARIVRLLLVVLALAALGAGGWWWLRGAQQPASRALVLHGNVDIRQVELAFNASGRIARILVQEGARVTKGQLLAELDVRQLRNAVAQAQALSEAQQQVLARLQAGSRPEEIEQAKATAEAARIDARNAQSTYRRQRELVARHFVAQQQADDARAAAEAARARLKATEEALRLVVLGPRPEDIAAAEATLQADRAALAIAQRALAEGSLYAPEDGVVENRVLQPGDMASPQKTVFTLALTRPLWVRAYLSEPELGKIRIGSLAEVATDSYPGRRYRAWVGYISPTAEFTPKSVETQEVRTMLVYQVRVFVCAPHDELRLGMPATVDIPLDQPVPAGAHEPAGCGSGA